MVSHGWGVSHDDCAASFHEQQPQLGVEGFDVTMPVRPESDSLNDSKLRDHWLKARNQVYNGSLLWFDSYFTELHVLALQDFELRYSIDRKSEVNNELDVTSKEAMFQFIVPANATAWARGMPGLRYNERMAPNSGRYGLTPGSYLEGLQPDELLDFDNLSRLQNRLWLRFFFTLKGAGCVSTEELGEEAFCSTLVIGNASITAVNSLRTWHNAWTQHATSWLLPYLMHKSGHYHVLYKNRSLPWCMSHTDIPHLIRQGDHRTGVVVGERFAELDAIKNGSRVNMTSWDNANILQNCSFWDERGMGYVHGSQTKREPSQQQAGKYPAKKLTETLQYWLNVSDRLEMPSKSFAPRNETMKGWGYLQPYDLESAMQQIVADATRLLKVQANQELAVTDSTKSVGGAVLDITITILGIVAMASGHGDIYNWCALFSSRTVDRCLRIIGHFLGHPPRASVAGSRTVRYFAKLCTCIIVGMGLVIAPIYILASEASAAADNADGSSSQVGLLAAETIAGRPDAYVVVAAVTVRLEAVRDETARVLEIVNMALAAVAALWICFEVIWPLPEGGRREILRHMGLKDS
jgi:hypothetical protein